MARQTMILSGVAQNVYSSFQEAKDDAVKGKLLFARVSGLTSGFDANGNLQVGDTTNSCSKTYVFMGKKCYGSFPQLPLELIKAIGIDVDEANGGSFVGDKYFHNTTLSSATNVIEALQLLANNSGLKSSGNTILVSNEGGVNNVEVHNDNVTIITDEDGMLSVATSALSAVTKVELDDKSKDVAFVQTQKIGETNNSAITIGLSGGAEGQIIKKSGDSYVWDYESSTDIASGANSGVFVSVKVDKTTGEKTYKVNGAFFISGNTDGKGSSASTSYKLMVLDGETYKQVGDEIKLLNDTYLQSVEIGTSGDPAQKGFIYTWVVKTQEGVVETQKTFVPLNDLDTYVGGSGITINDGELNVISVDLSTASTNILKFDGEEGSGSTLYASAVTDITLNGTELDVVDNKVDLGKLVSAITTTYNGEENEAILSGAVSSGGVLNVDLHLSAQDIPFVPSATSAVNSALTATNVQEIINDITKELSGATDGILTISANGEVIATYNPSADSQFNIPTIISATIGDEKYGVATAESGNTLVIPTISASAITFAYTNSGNTSWSATHESDETVDDTLNSIIDELALINDNSISGLSAISATTDESGNTEISLTLNPSNTKSQGDGIISSEIGATAIADSTKEGPTNAVKMSQDTPNGLFVYIEIVGDDVDEEEATHYIAR